MKDVGKLIILASHVKDGIEELCDEVFELENGKILSHSILIG